MAAKQKKNFQKYYKFLLYLVIIVLINAAGITLFYKIDLTSNNLYSLSNASKTVVKGLKEPLTINVFFTKNLPAPYNVIEPYLRDILKEYESYSGQNLSYRFKDVSAQEGDISQEADSNRKEAESYGIYPMNVQKLEQDEAKVMRAYMGMVLLHGDLVEKIPAITTTEGLEYKITTAIMKMTNKVSALVKLPEKIKVSLVLSSSLFQVSRVANIKGLDTIRTTAQEAVDRCKSKAYGQLTYEIIDPSMNEGTPEQQALADRFGLQWPDISTPEGVSVPAGKGVAAIQLKYGNKTVERSILNRNMALTQKGLEEQFSIIETKDIEAFVNDNIDNLIEINENIGYLASNNTLLLQPELPAKFDANTPRPPKKETLDNFNNIVSKQYSFKTFKFDNEIPDTFNTLIIAGAKQNFTDWELFQIDQYLMKGKSLAIFVDAFNEIQPQNQQQFQDAVYLPVNTGLEKLLDYYGLNVKKSYVLDESCYVNRDRGGDEMKIYFVPIIKNDKINHNLSFMDNLTQMLVIKASPLEYNKDRIKQNGLKLTELISSSDKSWEMAGKINLMPFLIQPPTNDKERGSRPLACILEGEFPSYFADKQIPQKPENNPVNANTGTETGQDKKDVKDEAAKPAAPQSTVQAKQDFISKGKPGKIFLIGTAQILRNNGLDEEGASPNAIFLMNIFDYLNNRTEIAEMRGKNQKFNVLDESKPLTKTIVKIVNIAGLPAMFILFGIIVWVRRSSRRKKIQSMFSRDSNK